MKDISRTPNVNTDRRLGIMESVAPLKRMSSSVWLIIKKDTVRMGDTIMATIVLLALGPLLRIIEKRESTTSVPKLSENIYNCIGLSVLRQHFTQNIRIHNQCCQPSANEEWKYRNANY